MKTDLFSLWFILFAEISSAFMYTNIHGVTIYYNITYTNMCHDSTDMFSVKRGLSVTQCVDECGLRTHCASLTYRRRHGLCELFLSAEDEDVRRGDCIFINVSDIYIAEMPCGNCAYGEMCDLVRKRCVRKECLDVAVPTNGQILGNRKSAGDMLKYECTHGYRERNGVTSAVCLETGQWNASANCVIDCENHPPISNGHVTVVSLDIAIITCEEGYTSTNTILSCTESVSWNNVTCDPIVCGEPPAIAHGAANLDAVNGINYLNTASVSCEVGYIRTKATIVCGWSGFWDAVACDRIVCGYPPTIAYGNAVLDSNNGIYYLDTATVTCDDSYQLETNKIKCTITGTWETTSCIDCFPATPQEYTGRRSYTKSGRLCQRWDSQFSHKHDNTDLQYFPDQTLADANNYCRTPEPGDYDPWCYTVDPGKEWEYCNVKKCPWV